MIEEDVRNSVVDSEKFWELGLDVLDVGLELGLLLFLKFYNKFGIISLYD